MTDQSNLPAQGKARAPRTGRGRCPPHQPRQVIVTKAAQKLLLQPHFHLPADDHQECVGRLPSKAAENVFSKKICLAVEIDLEEEAGEKPSLFQSTLGFQLQALSQARGTHVPAVEVLGWGS